MSQSTAAKLQGQQVAANSAPVVLASDTNPLPAEQQIIALLASIMTELRVHSVLLQAGQVATDDLDRLRSDQSTQ
jgi:hypothetical protein